jgi:hypothetical protein
MTRTRLLAHRAGVFAALAALTLAAAACGDGDDDDGGGNSAAEGTSTTAAPVIDPGDGGDYHPTIDPADFVDTIDNPYLPFLPGTKWVYEGEDEGKHERDEVEVTSKRREVMGVSAVVVSDTSYVDGKLAEETEDWYAQDRDGNVWYMGEATTSYEEETPSTEGSWEAGVDGALPGIVMPAHPEVGHAYRQEYYEGEAEDMGEILAVDGTVEVPTGRYDKVVVTRDWTPIEPDIVEEKQYAPGIGSVREELTAGGEGSLELVEYTPPA